MVSSACARRSAANNTANGTGGADRIEFSIAGPGPHSIALTAALPTVTQAVIIDGTVEPDFAGTPVIELNGAGAGASSSSGILLGSGSSGSTVKGLVINRFSLSGIRIEGGSGGNLITGNYLGTDTTGLLDRGNTKWGLEVSGGNNVIGGSSAALRNVISGNDLGGVSFNGAPVTGNLLQDGYIDCGQRRRWRWAAAAMAAFWYSTARVPRLAASVPAWATSLRTTPAVVWT